MNTLNSCFIQVLNMSITAAYVIAGVLLLRLLMKRLPKKYSYVLWGIAGLRLLLPFSIESGFSLFNLEIFRTIHQETGRTMAYIPPEIGYEAQPGINTGISAINNAVNSSLPAANPAGSVNPMQIYLFFGSVIWLAGIGMLLIYMAASWLNLQKKVRFAVLWQENGKEGEPDKALDKGRGFAGMLSGYREKRCRIYESHDIPSPFVMGICKPRIYIPFHLEEKERSYILAHEKYHIRRRDTLVKTAAFLIASVYWFHPMVWMAYFLMLRDMEMSCDEHVLKQFGTEIKQDYSRFLLEFAMPKKGFGKPQLLGPLAFGESMAGKRIKNILNFKKPALWIGVIAVVLTAALALVCLTDRKNSSILQVTAGKAGEPYRFAISCRHDFASDINGGLIYADFYEDGIYQDRIEIAALDWRQIDRSGEGLLALGPDVQPEQRVAAVEFQYTDGGVSGFAAMGLGDTEGLGFGISHGSEGIMEYDMRSGEPRMIASAFIGREGTGRIEVISPDRLTELGIGSDTFTKRIAENKISMLIYMVISEENTESLELKHLGYMSGEAEERNGLGD